MNNRFVTEEEWQAAFEAADSMLETFIVRGQVSLSGLPSTRLTTRKGIAICIATAVIRSEPEVSGDITDLPGVSVESYPPTST